MTPEREQIIRELWKRVNHSELRHSPHGYCVPVSYREPMKSTDFDWSKPVPQTEPILYLKFRLERGGVDGVRFARVICEGIELARWNA